MDIVPEPSPASGASYEVEVRCRFGSTQDAYRILPFLEASLEQEVCWLTRHYGEKLFLAGQVLRMSEVETPRGPRHYLGWKGPDLGRFANIREEINEDITQGIQRSAILARLGAKRLVASAETAANELERLGHRQFMLFRGRNLLGYSKGLGISVKLMSCAELTYPLLVELEKTAATTMEANQREAELELLCAQLGLNDRRVREEPPSLLWAQRRNPT